MSQAVPGPGIRVVAAGARSVAVGGPNYGQITTGDHSPITVTRFPALRAVAEVPPTAAPVGMPGPVPLFVGRAGELSRIERALAAGPGAVVHVVHGLGGVGKSALAAHHALTSAHRYRQIVWITADDPAGIAAGLRRFALALEPSLAVLPSEALVERAVAWLSEHRDWLVVLDNAETAEDVAPLLAAVGGGGRILVTSRSTVGWHRIGAGEQSLGSLTAEDAIRLLGASAKAGPGGPDGGREVCAALGFLPLAVVQAGAYLAQTGLSGRDYVRLIAEHPAAVYARGDEGTDPGRTIARVWRVTLDRLAGTPLAAEVLRVLAWFAPDAIDRGLLDGLADEAELTHALGRLAAYSMITREPGDHAGGGSEPRLTVHRLVQALARTPDPEDPHRTPDAVARARTQATALLVAAMPGTPTEVRTWAGWQRLSGHVAALAEHAAADTDNLHTAGLLNQAGVFARLRGDLGTGIAHLRRAGDGFRRLAGPDDPSTLICTHNLADALRVAGDAGQAVPLFEQTVAAMRRVLGEDHVATLRARTNLALTWLKNTGEVERAVALLERNLADYQRVLGRDHPNTMVCGEALASAYSDSGDVLRAIALLEQNLAGLLVALGPDHPNTLHNRNNLAVACGLVGDTRRACALLEQTLDISLRVLGEDHPTTLSTRNNLACAVGEAGDSERAVALLERNLDDRRRVLGEDHPDTLASRHNLAAAHLASHDTLRALPLAERAAADARRLLGPGHPGAVPVVRLLADARAEIGDLERAVPLYTQVLSDARRVLGDDHGETIALQRGLGCAYLQAGDVRAAEAPLAEALAGCRRVLGEDDLDSQGFHADLTLARAVRMAAEHAAVYEVLDGLFLAARWTFGEDHPRYLLHCEVLAAAYHRLGDAERAVPAGRTALALARRIFGDDHPRTGAAAAALAAMAAGPPGPVDASGPAG
ncbi:tetratricopeptide repeat protein [Kitasatospora sp. RG8]|uniref:tetratricopeptide repeat protein n=1 Tax=Kitasatospora sp. RG8 TaxID=2820815 RepID=UPI001AE069AF|nr:tetratricopeptide repeat protein [Kitasatospora sp. RG8]MBP0450470.1 tetratricopeptide repeat protein [Kitasatospora sp. RG8]